MIATAQFQFTDTRFEQQGYRCQKLGFSVDRGGRNFSSNRSSLLASI